MPAKNTTRTTPHQNSSRPASSPAWKFVDRWVQDPKIRRDTLIALGMILGAAVIVVLVGTALLAPLAIKILTGAAAGGGLGWGGYRLARRRRNRRFSRSSVPRPRQARGR